MKAKAYNKSLLKIFIALFILMITMFSLSYYIFKNSVNAIYNQINENNRIVFKSVVKSFDSCFKEINNIIFGLNELPYSSLYSLGTEPVDYYEAHLVRQKIASMINSIEYIEEVIIFSEKSDFIISSGGTMNFNSMITSKFKSSLYPPEFWKGFAGIKHSSKVIPSSVYSEYDVNTLGINAKSDSVSKRKLLVVVGSNMVENSKLNILVFVNEDKLMKVINQQNMVKGTSLMVLNEEKNILWSSGEDLKKEKLQLTFPNNEFENTVKQGNYRYYNIRSEYNNFIYVNRIAYSLDTMFQTVKVNQIVMITTILLGILMAIGFTFYLYRPFDKIAKLMVNKEGGKDKDKFSQIYRGISMIQNENEMLKKHLIDVEQDVTRSVFLKMIDDVTYYKSLSNQIESHFKVIFGNERFMIVSFVLLQDVGTRSFEGDKDESSFHDGIISKLKVILSTRFQDYSAFYLGKMEYIALIAFNQGVKRSDIIRHIRKSSDDLRKVVQEDYHIVVAVSKIYSEVKACKYAYEDIKTCMAYRRVVPIDEIIDSEDIKYGADTYYPVDLIEKLPGYILTGNAKECREIISQVIKENITSNISRNKFISIVTSIFNVIVNTLKTGDYDKDEIEDFEKSFFDRTSGMIIFEDIQSLLNDMIHKSIEDLQFEDNKKIDKNFIMQYIHMHYSESLYLDNMAEISGTSPKYFSKFFKKAFGINFVDYLNKIRINHSKEYLKSTNMPVNEIAEKVGYFNSSTFTSTFKKNCGMSPSEYRKKSTM